MVDTEETMRMRPGRMVPTTCKVKLALRPGPIP